MMSDSTDDWKKLKLVRRHFMKYFKQMSGQGIDWPTFGYTVKNDGIWVNSDIYSEALLAGEAEVFYAHPTDDLTTPALSFPCDFYQASVFFDFMFEETGLVFDDLKIFIDSNDLKKLIDSNEFVVEMDTKNLSNMWLIEYQKSPMFKNNNDIEKSQSTVSPSYRTDEADSNVTKQAVHKKFNLEGHPNREVLTQKLMENWEIVIKAIDLKLKKENQQNNIFQTATEQTKELNILKDLSRNWEIVALVYGLLWMNIRRNSTKNCPSQREIAVEIEKTFKSLDIRNKHFQLDKFVSASTIQKEALYGITGEKPNGR